MDINNIQFVPPEVQNVASKYFIQIKWDGDFRDWNMIRFSTPMDGHCLFHAILNAFFEPYHKELLGNKKVSRLDIVTQFRKSLSLMLSTHTDPNNPNSSRYYDLLNHGTTAEFSVHVPEFSIDNMKSQLESDSKIGYGYLELIANAIQKDIYILEGCRQNIYILDNPSLIIKGNRESIVLYYTQDHYELVGIISGKNVFDTHFSPHHPFIKFLYHRIFPQNPNITYN